MSQYCVNNFFVQFDTIDEADSFRKIFTKNGEFLFAMERFLPVPEALTNIMNIYHQASTIPERMMATLVDMRIQPKGAQNIGLLWDTEKHLLYDAQAQKNVDIHSFFDITNTDIHKEVHKLCNAINGQYEATLEEALATFLQKTGGFTHVTDWTYANWGVPEDVQTPFSAYENSFATNFETPLGPPVPFFKKLSETFSDDLLYLEYFEPSTNFFGKLQFQNGNILEIPCENHDVESDVSLSM